MVSITDTINSNGPWNTSYYSSDFKLKGSSNRKINIDSKANESDSLALFKTIKNQRYRQALLLLQGGIDVNGRNENGETPLIYLSKALNRRENKKMRQKFAKMLLDMGANPNIQDFRGTTPLMMASIKGQEDLVQTFLADNNTDITIQDREGNTALMHAARLGYIPVVQAFIGNFLRRELDASLLRQRNNQGKNALELAKEEGKTECARLMTNFLTQFNETLNEDSMKRLHMQNTLIPKVKSLDSIHMDKDALVFHSIMNGYSREDSDCDYHRDTRSDGFESALRNRIEHLQQSNNRRFTDDPSDYYEEIWQQETVSWFNGDKDAKTKGNSKQFSDRMNNNLVDKKSNKSAESVKLPPIGHRKLVDYKTWCELGNKIKEKRNH